MINFISIFFFNLCDCCRFYLNIFTNLKIICSCNEYVCLLYFGLFVAYLLIVYLFVSFIIYILLFICFVIIYFCIFRKTIMLIWYCKNNYVQIYLWSITQVYTQYTQLRGKLLLLPVLTIPFCIYYISVASIIIHILCDVVLYYFLLPQRIL